MKPITAILNANGSGHQWTFFRAGGFDQVRLAAGADLMALDQLDQKLWVALSCPTHGLEFDTKTLEMIDTDGDGRIRVREIIDAVQWAGSMLKNPDDLTRGAPELPLAAINDQSPEGAMLLHSAREILTNLGKADSPVITTTDTTDTEALFALTMFNGDGIIPAEASEDPEIQQTIRDIMDCLGSETDRSGLAGISREMADRFFADIRAYVGWRETAEEDGIIQILGRETAPAAAAMETVQAKIDDYFARCRIAAFDERAVNVLNRQEADYTPLADTLLSPQGVEVGGFPLSAIAPDRPLPLKSGLNPAWIEAVSLFDTAVVEPILGGKSELTEDQWAMICSKFAAYRTWQVEKAGDSVEKLGIERIREISTGQAEKDIGDLLTKDEALKDAFDHITAVDQLIRYHRDLFLLLNNFVAFSNFYTRKGKTIFLAGTLYLDGRSCELCIRVHDVEKHAALATLSSTYLAYCDCTRRGGSEKMVIAAAFTGGDSDFLILGRNGVFYDNKGQDWDATIIKLIDHPISIRQAFWSPYKRIGKMIREQIIKRAAAREQAQMDKAAAGVADTTQKLEAGKAPPPPPKPPFDVGKFAGIFAAIGLAVGAIGTAIASAASGFLQLQWWQMPLVVAAIILIISIPSMILAWLKLRQRSLGPILDACGWAVNARVRLNVPFGGSLTKMASLPAGSVRLLDDRFADKKSPWPKILIGIAILLIVFSLLQLTGLLTIIP